MQFVSKVHRIKVRVGYQDTDQARVVHHATYLRYLESARIEFFRAHGFDYDRFEKETGLGLPVIEAQVHYKRACRFDDVLEIETRVGPKTTRATLWLDAVIRREGEIANLSKFRLACVHMTETRLQMIPRALFDACLEPGFGV